MPEYVLGCRPTEGQQPAGPRVPRLVPANTSATLTGLWLPTDKTNVVEGLHPVQVDLALEVSVNRVWAYS